MESDVLHNNIAIRRIVTANLRFSFFLLHVSAELFEKSVNVVVGFVGKCSYLSASA
jgi:hypothetical protein